MSGRDPIQALMKRAGIESKNAPTRHPEKALIVAERFHKVAELLETGDVIAAGVAASQAQALFEVVHAMWKQDRHEELLDPSCKAKRHALEVWDTLLNPDEHSASKLATHYRENRLNWFDTRPPYKAPPKPPKAPIDASRFVSTFVANDVEAAEKYGLPTHIEFKHGVSAGDFPYSVKCAVERKFKAATPEGWRFTVWAYEPTKASHFGPNFPTFEFNKSEEVKGRYVQHTVGYRIQHTTHSYQERIDARDGSVAKKRKKAKA